MATGNGNESIFNLNPSHLCRFHQRIVLYLHINASTIDVRKYSAIIYDVSTVSFCYFCYYFHLRNYNFPRKKMNIAKIWKKNTKFIKYQNRSNIITEINFSLKKKITQHATRCKRNLQTRISYFAAFSLIVCTLILTTLDVLIIFECYSKHEVSIISVPTPRRKRCLHRLSTRSEYPDPRLYLKPSSTFSVIALSNLSLKSAIFLSFLFSQEWWESIIRTFRLHMKLVFRRCHFHWRLNKGNLKAAKKMRLPARI